MPGLNYEKRSDGKLIDKTEIYQVASDYSRHGLMEHFLELKANVCDLTPAVVARCITGTEQDYIMLMKRASEYIDGSLTDDDAWMREKLLKMFKECVFGYYVLTPLIEADDVSDIKILGWNHIVVKADGDRYRADVSFYSEEDYRSWYERILRIQKLGRSEESALSHCTDRKGSDRFYLRMDAQLHYITSDGKNNLHLRKLPKEKLGWEYLKRSGMLNDDIMEYLKDRILSGYSILLSGRGGSGKTTLLNLLIDWIPFNESGLVSQESDELYSSVHPQMQFEHTMALRKTDGGLDYTLEDELRLGLLQDIDNFIIGEIKGGEALYVFTTAMSTGARFFGTIHANDASGSVRRLAQCARYVSDYSVESLEEMLADMPFVLVHMSHFSVDEIAEIDGWDDSEKKLVLRRVYRKEPPC